MLRRPYRYSQLLLAFGLLGAALQAQAQVEALEKCRAEREPMRRLACYDAIALPAVRPAAAPAATPVAPAQAVGAAAAAPAAADAQFGLPAAGQGQAAIESRIAGVVEGWGPRTQFRLTNGQVWQVEDGSSASIYLRDPAVRVRRGFAGAFYIEFEGSNRTPRVRRVQ